MSKNKNTKDFGLLPNNGLMSKGNLKADKKQKNLTLILCFTRCVSGCGEEESTIHLFFECPIFSGILSKICNWFRLKIAFHNLMYFDQFKGLISSGMNILIKCWWYGLLVFRPF